MIFNVWRINHRRLRNNNNFLVDGIFCSLNIVDRLPDLMSNYSSWTLCCVLLHSSWNDPTFRKMFVSRYPGQRSHKVVVPRHFFWQCVSILLYFIDTPKKEKTQSCLLNLWQCHCPRRCRFYERLLHDLGPESTHIAMILFAECWAEKVVKHAEKIKPLKGEEWQNVWHLMVHTSHLPAGNPSNRWDCKWIEAFVVERFTFHCLVLIVVVRLEFVFTKVNVPICNIDTETLNRSKYIFKVEE